VSAKSTGIIHTFRSIPIWIKHQLGLVNIEPMALATGFDFATACPISPEATAREKKTNAKEYSLDDTETRKVPANLAV